MEKKKKNAYTIYLAARFYQETATLYPEDIAKTEALYRQAIELSPKRQQFWYSLADFYRRTGRIQQSTAIQKDLLSYDPEQGQPLWAYGVSLMSQGQKKEGAEYMRNAMNTPFPYSFSDTREVLQLVEAYQVLDDKEGLKTIPKYLVPTLTIDPSTLPVYLEIANRLERAGLTDAKQQVLDFATQYVDPAARSTYERGNITGATKSTAPVTVPSSTPPSAASSASSSDSNLLRTGGPRR